MKVQNTPNPVAPPTRPQSPPPQPQASEPKDEMTPQPPPEHHYDWGKIGKSALIGAGVAGVGAGAGALLTGTRAMGPVAAGALGMGAAGGAIGVVTGGKELLNSNEGLIMLVIGVIFPPALLMVAAIPAAYGVTGAALGAAAGAGLGALGARGPAMLAAAVATGALINGAVEMHEQGKHL